MMAFSQEDVLFLERALELKEERKGGSKVGAVLVSMGEGVSKLPPGMSYMDNNEYLKHVIHAEINAIKDWERHECLSLYTVVFPCEDCAKAIVEKKIKRQVYIEEYTGKSGDKILEAAGIECIQVPKGILGI